MKSFFILFAGLFSSAIFGQSLFQTWYLETLNGIPPEFNSEVPYVKADILEPSGDDPFVLDTSVCGHLKVHFELPFCECTDIMIMEILELDETGCTDPDNTILQQTYFDYFILEPGEDSRTYHYSFSELAGDVLRLELRWNEYGDPFMTFLNVKLGLDEVSESEFIVFPNPSDSKFYFSDKPDRISIYTTDGKRVLSAENSESADLTALPPGIYLLEAVMRNQKTISRKLIRK